jgi:regulator of sigma E protease
MFFIQLAAALIVTLGVLIVVHELGHYVVARLAGVGILRFAIGLGPPLWKRVDARGTEWVVAALPVGGYVRMLDAREDAGARPARLAGRSFDQLSPQWRIAIALGGPGANFLLACVAFWCVVQLGVEGPVPAVAAPAEATPAAAAGIEGNVEIVAVDGTPTPTWQAVSLALARRLGDSGSIEIATRRFGAGAETVAATHRIGVEQWLAGDDDPDLLGSLGLVPALPAVFGVVVPDSPAAAAGFAVGDHVLAVDGAPVADWLAWQRRVEASPDTPLIVTLSRDGTAMDLAVTPRGEAGPDGARVGRVGVGAARRTLRLHGGDAVAYALTETWRGTLLTVGFIGKMVSGLVSSRTLSGPITIASVARDAADVGAARYIELLALLSISLGVLNLLPIPVLDGGHVLYAGIELLRRRPLPDRVQAWGLQVGFVIVGGLMLLAIYNDLLRVFGSL